MGFLGLRVQRSFQPGLQSSEGFRGMDDLCAWLLAERLDLHWLLEESLSSLEHGLLQRTAWVSL